MKDFETEAIPLDKRVIFALDLDSPKEAQDWVKTLEGRISFFKVGLQLFLAGGFEILDWIVNRDLDVMLDLKLYDVPRTIQAAIGQIERYSQTFLTVHADRAVMEAAAHAATNTEILAVTALTSWDQGDIEARNLNTDMESLVLERTRQCIEAGLSGVVCSGWEVKKLRESLGKEFTILVPGIRAQSEQGRDDQKRTVSTADAFEAGADHVVVGRPIREANSPELAAQEMLKEIEEVL